jgi:hypothetical protein
MYLRDHSSPSSRARPGKFRTCTNVRAVAALSILVRTTVQPRIVVAREQREPGISLRACTWRCRLEVTWNEHLQKRGRGYPCFFGDCSVASAWMLVSSAGAYALLVAETGVPDARQLCVCWGGNQDASKVSSTISGFVPTRKGGPHVPTPQLVKTRSFPKRWRP